MAGDRSEATQATDAATFPADVIERVRATLAPDGRDRRLLDGQVFLAFDTRQRLYESFTAPAPAYVGGTRPALELAVTAMTAGVRPGMASALALMTAVSRLAPAEPNGLDRSEEEILAVGEATPLERARLLAVLARVAAIGSRVCLLYRPVEPAFHAVCELRIMNAWSIFDPLANVFYILPHHTYPSAWELKQRPSLVDHHPEHARKPTVDSTFYRAIAIANVEIAPPHA